MPLISKGAGMDERVTRLIDELVAIWDQYSEELVIRILSRDISRMDPDEQRIVSQLRSLLPGESDLAKVVIGRRHQPHSQESLTYDVPECRLCREHPDRMVAERIGREQKEIETRERVKALLNEIFERDFLNADSRFAQENLGMGVIDPAEYARLKAEFVRNWAIQTIGEALDYEQAGAVAAVDGNILVTARAGSGKTRTLVTRAIFLRRHCGVAPNELLLLAFNRAAAAEMRGRLRDAMGDDLPHVMTFHALAHALVKPQQKLLSDNSATGQLGLSRKVQSVIEAHIESDEYRAAIQEIMTAHFREDLQRVVDGRLLSAGQLVDYRRRLPRITLGGDLVATSLEKAVADTLFEHNVPYHYQRDFPRNGVNYRPDFAVVRANGSPSPKVIIECFGAAGDDDYDGRMPDKRCHWRSLRDQGWTLLEFFPGELQDESGFVGKLLEQLRQAGVRYRRLSEQEIWERIRGRAVDRFTEAAASFIGHCRRRDLSPAGVADLVDAHDTVSEYESKFLEVGKSIFAAYLDRLATDQSDDFSGLMWRAIAAVRNGKGEFVRDGGREHGDLSRLKFVMIDEFQDFSRMFYELVDAIRGINPGARFFCVGDDWQAINAFAGSELRYFENFEDYFDHPVKREITTNYRSAASVVEAGNALMRRENMTSRLMDILIGIRFGGDDIGGGKGMPARALREEAGILWLGNLDRFNMSPFEADKYRNYGKFIPAVLRIVWHFLQLGQDVVLLSRKNRIGMGVNRPIKALQGRIRSLLPPEYRSRVSVSTVHRYKGKERDAVIVLDAVQNNYPLIHPNWIFTRVFGDSPEKIEREERRLLYVAMTRAKESLAIITDSLQMSPFLAGIGVPRLEWDDLDPPPAQGGGKVAICVYDAYEVRGQLRSLGYEWDPAGKYWHKVVSSEGFSFEDLCAQPWAVNCKIEIYSEGGELLCVYLDELADIF